MEDIFLETDSHFSVSPCLCGGGSLAVDFKLYLITDRKQMHMPLPEAVRLALEGGVRAIQLREKDLPIRELLALGRELRSLTKEFGARLFINDRFDVAVAAEADGVHLGQQSMPVSAVRKIAGQGMMIGVSTHNLYEAKDAEAGGADFITFGPVFSTPSKLQYGAPLGLEALAAVKQRIRIPVFGLGGIKPGSLSSVLQAGADGIAMISAVFAADDIRKAARTILDKVV
jgi:thiamine-phosphate pyrophosphorylase